MVISRTHIIKGRPDIVVAVINAAALERSLYLVSELLALPVPIVVGLNMMDVAVQQGFQIEPHVLEAALGLPVVPMVATRNQGVRELLEAVEEVLGSLATYSPHCPEIREDHREVLAQLGDLIADHVPSPYPADWVAVKLLEGDEEITQMIRERLGVTRWEPVHDILKTHEDAVLAVAGGRYEWIGRMVRAAVMRPRAGQITLTDRLDRVATHPVWGFVLLLAILGMIFWLTYRVGAPLQRLLDVYLVGGAAAWVRDVLAGAPWWLVGMLADGIIAGAGMVITLVPILVIFFATLGVLEDTGYMARAAYVMDRFMHWMGLHGRSFLPLCLGFGCNVPAVVGARIVDSPKARLLTILLVPFVPCTARMAVLALLAPIFFGSAAFWVSWGLVGLSLLFLGVVGVALHELVLGGEHVAFIMELPLYHAPNSRAIAASVWLRTVSFLRKAGTIILVVSVAVWALSVLPGGSLETSYLAAIGQFLAPLGAWMGLSWEMMVALLTGFVAKENTLATLGVLYGAGGEGTGLSDVLVGTLSPAAALAFLTVLMLFMPCAATLAAIRQEAKSWRWTAFSVVLMLAISFGAGIAIYQGAAILNFPG